MSRTRAPGSTYSRSRSARTQPTDSDKNCIKSMDITRGYNEVRGDTPNDAIRFMTRYRGDPDYRNHIHSIWGARAYPLTTQVMIDGKTEHGITHGWGKECTGKMKWTGPSRHNARRQGVKCCSKFRNGEMAFNLPGPANPFKGEDCGYGWSGERADIPNFEDNLKLIRRIAPAAWMGNFLALREKKIQNTNINLVSGQEFARMNVEDQLQELIYINHEVCNDLIPSYFGDSHPTFITKDESGCNNCKNKLLRFVDRQDADNIEKRECKDIINRIFRLYLKIHELADIINREQTNTLQIYIKVHLKKFSKGFLDLCNMIEELPSTGGKKSRKLRRKVKKSRKVKRRAHKKTKKRR